MSALITHDSIRTGISRNAVISGARTVHMASSGGSTATPSRHAFENDIEEVKLSKTDLNAVVMDYLISEGYPGAAQNFAREANILPMLDVPSVEERVTIREALYRGNIEGAIDGINELDPQLLERDPSLHFALLRLQLIELIRPVLHDINAEIKHICTFAEINLAPRASVDAKSLDDLEEAMGLLIFDPDKLAEPMAALLQPELRQEVGQRVNQALLRSCGERTKATLYDLVNHRAWANQKAIEAKKQHLPDCIELGVESPKNGHDAPQNGSSHHSNGEREIMATDWERY